MHTLIRIEELAAVPGPIFLAIGVFDGVHLGHRAVIERALSDAQSGGGTAVVATFDPHPLRVLRPEKAPRILTSTPHKLRLIRALGVEYLLVLPFTREFADTEPDKFLRDLAGAGRPLREICVGHEWCFGRNRAGNLALMAEIGRELGFDEVGVPAVQIDGEVASSTLIRSAIEAGDLARAARFLGREYAILGTVVRGDGIGRKLGFPTANLAAHNEQFPPNGVYAVDVQRNGTKLRGVVNIGVRPTVANASGERLLEVHLFDFSGDIYGEDIEVAFRKFLRSEQKFPSLDALKAQIAEDVATARAYLDNSSSPSPS
jgi:riboflavin kinase / FMN adenylyltransferase